MKADVGTYFVLRAPCGCVCVAATNPSPTRQRELRREARARGCTVQQRVTPTRLRETWTCGEEDCPFQAEVRAEEGRA